MLHLKVSIVNDADEELGSVAAPQDDLQRAGAGKLPFVLCAMVKELADAMQTADGEPLKREGTIRV